MFFLRRLHTRGVKVEELDDIRVCAIGQASADKLRDAHVHVDVVPSQSKAEGVFAALNEFVGGIDQLRGLNILLPRAAVARDRKSLRAAVKSADFAWDSSGCGFDAAPPADYVDGL